MNRYFAGEATADEMAELAGWIRSDDENKRQFEEYLKSWKAVHHASVEKRINLDAEWISLQKNIEAGKKSHTKKTGTKPLWGYTNAFRIAASIIIIVGIFLIMKFLVLEDELHKIVAETGITEVSLPDGSIVTLNRGAVLKYPENFDPEVRNVEIKGEAFFEIDTDTARPFILSYSNVKIEVLGTSFYIASSAKSEKFDIVLVEGKVSIYYKEKPVRKVIMQPHDRATVSLKENKIVKKVNTDPNYLSWKTRYFVFENTPLTEVMKKLEKTYGKNIIFANPNISNCRLTATFDDQTLTSILKVLQATFDIKIVTIGERIRLEGSGCKQ